ncbi:MAG: leucine-rich repeat protein, partial [Lentimicrobiaceae bacterium]|nr:leucine-rich repeat protein [Lentimicrobiaceae bacterium]
MAVIICCFFAVGLHGQTVGPLLTTQWGQSQPFRDMCPQLNNSNIRCPVGCVATAMAQIMKYHQYPAQGVGQSTAYVTGLGASIPSVSFAVNYDWNNMLDFYLGNITTAQEDSAVALLSYHCGVSVRMEYGPMSAAAIYSVAEALPTYFGYDKGILYRERAYYSDSIWENMLKTELDSGRPVFYSGGMHAFVCDGYDNNGMFHFNWGWNGGSDGYFLSSALNLGDEPGAGSATFNTNQAIVVNIKPDAGGTPTKYECALRNYFASPLTSAMPGDTLTITTFFMFFQDNFPGGDLGVALVDSNDQIAAVIGSLSSVPNERSMWTFGPWDIHCTVPLGTPYGQYKLKALVKDTGNWEIITLSSGCPNYIDFRIGLPIAATGINLNKSVDTIAFFVYDSEQLTKSIVPNNATNHAVIWSSSDTNLMNVGNGLLNSGLVTAKLTGTAIITATAVAGGFKDSSYVEATACKKSTTGSLAWEMCDDGTLTISGSGNMPNYNNPDLFEDGPPWHLYRKFITTVIIGDSVTRIGENAFIRCPNLTSVSIPKSITHIGDGAFGGCSSLDSITIPNSVTSIGNNAFYGCSSLKTLYFNATNCANFTHGNLWLYGDTSLTSVIIGNNVQTIPDYAFYDCNKLTAVIIPDSVVSIGTQAFSICSGLTSVTIGNSVASIGGHAFIGCSGLDSITIPESVESIGVGAFVNCSSLASLHFNAINCTIASSGWLSGDTSLTSVTIGEQVQTIPDLAFFECDKLTSVSIPDNVVRIGSWAFYGCSGLDSITIPESVASIGDRSFMFCSGLTILYFNAVNCANFTSTANHWLYGDTSLTSVIIGESVQTIPDYAFFNCNKLTAVIIPDSVATIGYAAFNVCSGLTSVTIGNNVVSIGNNAFSGCSGLTSVTIGNSVASIGNNAFYGCNGLDSIITYATTPPVLGFSVFSGIPINIPVYIPCLTYNLYSTATEWRNFTNFIINGTPTADTTFYSVVKCDNLPYTDDNFTTPIYSTGTYYNTLQNANGCDSIICLNIVYSNGTIGSLIWTICDSVLTISGNDTMPDYLSDVFVPWYPYRTAINAIVIDSGVATIGNSAFYGCSGLTSVIIPESVVSIGNNAFYGCSGLTS